MAALAGFPFIPWKDAGDAQDPSDITAGYNDLGTFRRCRRSDGGWYLEMAAYTSTALTANLGYRLSGAGYASFKTNPSVKAIATQDGQVTVAGCDMLVVPQATISAAGIYWFAFQGYVEATGGATISAGNFINWLHDGAGKFGDFATAQEGAAVVGHAVTGIAVDAAADATTTTIFMLGRLTSIPAS